MRRQSTVCRESSPYFPECQLPTTSGRQGRVSAALDGLVSADNRIRRRCVRCAQRQRASTSRLDHHG